MAATRTPPPRTRSERARAGLSILETLIVVGVVGIMSAVSFFLLPRDGLQLREASRLMAADLTRARSEAVRLNTNVAVGLSKGMACGRYCIFVDTNRDGVPDADFDGDPDTPDEVQPMLQMRRLEESFPLVTLTGASAGASGSVERIWFDVRGLPRASTGALLGAPVTITFKTSKKSHQVVLEPQGRIRVVVP